MTYRTLHQLQAIMKESPSGTAIPVTEDELEMLVANGYSSSGFRIAARKETSEMDKILTERGSRYGSFKTHALITQTLKAAMAMTPKWNDLSPSQKEALEMTAHKIGRILN